MNNCKKDNGQEEKQTVKKFIEDKYDVVVGFTNEHLVLTAVLISFALCGSAVGLGAKIGLENRKQNEKYISTTIDTQNGNYSIDDVYAVYNTEKVWFCNRKLADINEEEVINGSFRYGNGNISEYYYRNEIYEYYDLKTGEKICQTHEDGFYIESLMDLYSKKEVKEHNYQFSLDDLEKEKNIEYMLSRDPGLKRK